MVSQFVSSHQVNLLGDLGIDFPEGAHAIGRLDNDSEGLLILTTNKKVTSLLFEGKTPHKRTYLVKVKYTVSPESLEKLKTGIQIPIKGGQMYTTLPCEAEILPQPPDLPPNGQETPEYWPYTWLKISLIEGKFHQVRKMTKALSHTCVRLIRVSIEDLELGDLQPGKARELQESDFFEKLNIPVDLYAS